MVKGLDWERLDVSPGPFYLEDFVLVAPFQFDSQESCSAEELEQEVPSSYPSLETHGLTLKPVLLSHSILGLQLGRRRNSTCAILSSQIRERIKI